ncbi:MAG: type II toxin-antitoxin system VapC family toxin [Pseudomonadota bacterium]
MKIVIDASVAAAWFLPDEQADYADSVLSALPKTGAVAPPLFKLEIANVFTIAVRRGRIESWFRTNALDKLNRLHFEFDDKGYETVWQTVPDIADEFSLKIYDALYLELAQRRNLQLATLDRKLIDAARKAGTVIFGVSG